MMNQVTTTGSTTTKVSYISRRRRPILIVKQSSVSLSLSLLSSYLLLFLLLLIQKNVIPFAQPFTTTTSVTGTSILSTTSSTYLFKQQQRKQRNENFHQRTYRRSFQNERSTLSSNNKNNFDNKNTFKSTSSSALWLTKLSPLTIQQKPQKQSRIISLATSLLPKRIQNKLPLSIRGGSSSTGSSTSLSTTSTVQSTESTSQTITTSSVSSATNTNTTNDNKYSRWKGENDVNFIQRLTYQYATPILQTASNNERQLDIYDALPINKQYNTKNKNRNKNNDEYDTVTDLQNIYSNLQKQQLTVKKSSSTLSSTWLLTKALLLSQKDMLVKTGILRLINTGVQAFPALLVSKLLRFAESSSTKIAAKGTTGTVVATTTLQEAIIASIALVVVLSIKMIIENQFFHNLSQMSSQVRLSLSGMIFDKSLQLQNGGSGTTLVSSVSSNNNNKKESKNNDSSSASTGATTATPTAGNNELGIGGVLNLMQSDTSIIENSVISIHTSWDGPLQIILYTTLLYKYLGSSIFYGIAVLLVTIPLNSITLRILNKLATYENIARDKRTKLTNESIQNMKLLKLLSWESLFETNIVQTRTIELNLFIYRGLIRALNMAISNAVPAVVLVVTLTAYVRTGTNPIVASTIFTAISLFNQLRFPLFFYPMFIDSMANGKNALKRISSYLNSQEIIPYVQVLPPVQLTSNENNNNSFGGKITTKTGSTMTGGTIELLNGNFVWGHSTTTTPASTISDEVIVAGSNDADDIQTTTTEPVQSTSTTSSSDIPALINANLKVKPGEIVAVVGGVGSGKSALIKALLGELRPTVTNTNAGTTAGRTSKKTKVIRHGDVAYCSQEAWLSKGTIREAILFGREYNEQRYYDSIYVAGLDDDIVEYSTTTTSSSLVGTKSTTTSKNNGQLTHETDVGEGGTSLSGGQRQRVAIARAMYSVSNDTEPKVYLFDDCLAALDAQVGATVFERLSIKLRQSNSATVFVTNDPNLPRRCDNVILMGPIASKLSSVPASASTSKKSSSVSANLGSTILHKGTYDELIALGYDIQRQVTSRDDDDTIKNSEHQTPAHDASKLSNVTAHSIKSNVNPTTTLSSTTAVNGTSSFVISTSASTGVTTESTKNIHVGFGATGGSNSTSDNTVCVEQWCQTDVEGQATMQNCPDYIAHHAESKITSSTLPMTPDDSTESIIQYFEATTPIVNDAINVTDGRTIPHISTTSALNNDPTLIPLIQHRTDASTSASTAVAVKSKPLSVDDTMSTGAVPLSTYISYFKAVRSPLLVVAMLSAFLMSNGAQFFQQYTVAKWTEAGASSAMVSSKYMSSLIKAALVVSISLWVRSFLTMTVGVRASKTFHSRLLRSVFAAPMSFFDATPSGQLLSRFGKEIETIDRSVPDSIASVLFCMLQIILSMGALASVVTPGMLIPLTFVSVLYVKAMSQFRPAARDMKRVETKTRSPIYTQFGEALRGSETIRSIRGASSNWSNQHRQLTNTNIRVYYTVKAFDRWLSTRLETLGNIVVFTTAIASVVLTRSGALKAGSAGWGLTQSLSITGLMTWAVRCLTDLEAHMLSVVRIKELSDGYDTRSNKDAKNGQLVKTPTMPKEMAAAGEALMPLLSHEAGVQSSNSTTIMTDGWPWKGAVEFKNVSMKYTLDGPYVLKNVNLSVPAGTTLGVVGRTGSGKSSLLAALFRLVEIEAEPGSPNGKIEIDGVDIRAVSMKTLRESLAIIPQDPILFTGTLRYNLDATGRSTEQEMIAALEAASATLAEQLLRAPNAKGLDTPILEGGKNLSLGQRQLVCLARAMLRKSKILVLDEATSSVDAKTDQEVQDTIRREFVNKGVTVMTVAHRLDTVLGYDKILVLGNGKVFEYGTPAELVALQGGELRKLVLADRANKEKGRVSSSQSQADQSKNDAKTQSSSAILL